MNEERAMTKTLLALVLIAGGILVVLRLVDTDKPVPARLSPPTGADQISEARRVSPTMSCSVQPRTDISDSLMTLRGTPA
jgi:hypothetical protein